MIKIYTKQGDEGFTSRPGGEMVRKCDLRMEAGGTIDELNSHLGLCIAGCSQNQKEICELLLSIQSDLLLIGAVMAYAGTPTDPRVQITEASVERFEQTIDTIWAQLPPLTHFILPGGSELACRLHIARTVCRRAERCLVAAADVESRIPYLVFRYINRLSDLLFALARKANFDAGQADSLWLTEK